jgi:hypothetical protein
MSAGIDERLYVQYGCGICAPAGWLNFDASPRLRLEQIPGICGILRSTVGLLFPSGLGTSYAVCRSLITALMEFIAVTCLNTLHGTSWLRRCVIRCGCSSPGPIFRLVVPDLHWRALRYVAAAANGKHSADDQFMSAANLGRGGRPKDLVTLARNCFGHSAHLWMYDFASTA